LVFIVVLLSKNNLDDALGVLGGGRKCCVFKARLSGDAIRKDSRQSKRIVARRNSAISNFPVRQATFYTQERASSLGAFAGRHRDLSKVVPVTTLRRQTS
jgi:hypothetical protein